MQPTILSHWHKSISGLALTPSDFYQQVETAVAARSIPQLTLTRTSFAEGTVFSARREYLRVKRGDHYFDICGAPFADGAFVSWWLTRETGCLPGCLGIIPFVGPLLFLALTRESYYAIDTRLMFQDQVHSAVLEVLDRLTAAKGIRALSEEERKPTIRELLR